MTINGPATATIANVSVGMSFVAVIAVAVSSLIGAFLLRAATQQVQKMDVSFAKAFGTVSFAVIVNLVVALFFGFAAGLLSDNYSFPAATIKTFQ